MEPKDAAATLTQAMSKTTAYNALYPLSQGLSAVAARMEPKDAAEAGATLTKAMSKTTDSNVLQSLSQDLARAAGSVEPKNAAKACGQAANTLTHAMT